MNPTPIDLHPGLPRSTREALLQRPGMLALLARHSFGVFAHMGIRILLGSNAPPKSLWHVQAMAHVVSDIAKGHCRRAIVTVPPRHLKSTVVTVEHIAWRIGQDPTLKILLVSYSKALSKDSSAKCERSWRTRRTRNVPLDGGAVANRSRGPRANGSGRAGHGHLILGRFHRNGRGPDHRR